MTEPDKKLHAGCLLAATLCFFQPLPLTDLDAFQSAYGALGSTIEATLSALDKAGLKDLKCLLCLLDILLGLKSGEALAARSRTLKQSLETLKKKVGPKDGIKDGTKDGPESSSTIEDIRKAKESLVRCSSSGLSLLESIAKRGRDAQSACPQFHGIYFIAYFFHFKS
jgi:hypothetical protein